MSQKILIIDDDEAVRSSIRALLESAGYEVREFPSALAFLDHSDLDHAAAILADIRMPGMDGLALLAILRQRGISLPVIVITGFADVALAVRAMKAGAVDLIEKPFEPSLLLDSLTACLKPAAAAAPVDDAAPARLASLTLRERQVLELLVTGRANKVIAHQLGISPRTVEIHRAHVMAKMAARHLSELVRMAIAMGVAP